MKKNLTYLFLAVQTILYVCFIAGDIFSVGQPKILKFISVSLIALFGLQTGKSRENRVVTLIFFFTVLADVFFVLMNKPIYGIGVYIIIQLLHSLRLTYMSDKVPSKELLKRIIPALILAFIGSFVGPMVALVLAYGFCIGLNIAHAAESNILCPNKRNKLYLISMIILVIGDLGVGLRNLNLDFITPQIAHIAYIVTWVTYIPSLIILLGTTDALLDIKKEKNNH